MSIDFEIPPEAKAVRERVRQWVKDECIPAEAKIKDKESYKKVLGGAWLQQTYDFPAQRSAGRNEPASTAVALMGFDERRQTWVRFFANSGGQYFPIRMTDAAGGWSWKYATFFARTAPETADPDAAFTRKSDSEYVIDGPSYPQGGTRVTEHHVCRKVSG